MPDSEDSDNAEESANFGYDDLEAPLAALSLRNQRKQIRHELTDPFVFHIFLL